MIAGGQPGHAEGTCLEQRAQNVPQQDGCNCCILPQFPCDMLRSWQASQLMCGGDSIQGSENITAQLRA